MVAKLCYDFFRQKFELCSFVSAHLKEHYWTNDKNIWPCDCGHEAKKSKSDLRTGNKFAQPQKKDQNNLLCSVPLPKVTGIFHWGISHYLQARTGAWCTTSALQHSQTLWLGWASICTDESYIVFIPNKHVPILQSCHLFSIRSVWMEPEKGRLRDLCNHLCSPAKRNPCLRRCATGKEGDLCGVFLKWRST